MIGSKKLGSLDFGGHRYDIEVRGYHKPTRQIRRWHFESMTQEERDRVGSGGGKLKHPIAVVLVDERGLTTMISSNVQDTSLGGDEFVISQHVQPELRQALLQTGSFEDTGQRVDHGQRGTQSFVQRAPVWRILAP